MKKIILAANWKMNLSLNEANDLMKAIDFVNHDNLKTMIFPSSLFLKSILDKFSDKTIIGSQNISEFENGAYTGEISAEQVKSLGITTTLIGHSERRSIFGESNNLVNLKIKRARANHLNIILCIGESLEEREQEKTYDILEAQIVEALDSISSEDFSSIIIAYEPVWAIGTGKTATAEIAQDAHAFIRKMLEKLYPGSEKTEILYGGSVKSSNIESLLAQKDIDGALIGGASLKADEFSKIIAIANQRFS